MTTIEKQKRQIQRLTNKVEELELKNISWGSVCDNMKEMGSKLSASLEERNDQIKSQGTTISYLTKKRDSLISEISKLKADHTQTLYTLKTMVENMGTDDYSIAMNNQKLFICKIISEKLTEMEVREEARVGCGEIPKDRKPFAC
jgi:cell division protein FtsB